MVGIHNGHKMSEISVWETRVIRLNIFLKMSNFDSKYLQNSSVIQYQCSCRFRSILGREFENEAETGTGSSFGAILRNTEFLGFSGFSAVHISVVWAIPSPC